MENVLFKVSFPAEFHAQTAVECALALHADVRDRLEDVEKVIIITQESAIRIIDKTGPLYNPADRDHCIQYMTAVALIFGTLTADHYEEPIASDRRVEALREKTFVIEDARYSRDYLDPAKRSIANSVQVFFKNGACTEKIAVDYPIGHRRRRAEAIPLLLEKFEANLASRLAPPDCRRIVDLFCAPAALSAAPVTDLMDMFAVKTV
jgi:2-methylcitrate dehydratase PrpD